MNIRKSLARRRFILVFISVLGIIGLIMPFVKLFGIQYKPLFGILVFASAVVISLVIFVSNLFKEWDIQGIRAFYPSRKVLSHTDWLKFFLNRKQPKTVYLLGHSLSRTFESEKLETFIDWCNKGVEFRILLLSYRNTEISQLLNVGKGMKNIQGVSPNFTLIRKIEEIHKKIQENFISRIPDIGKKPKLRFATCNLPFSMNAVDDDMLVTFYGTDAEADEQPTLRIHGQESQSYKSFLKEFNNIWDNHSKVVPDIDPIIKNLKKQWRTLLKLNNINGTIPSPSQAIIYPTYRCLEQCEYCMFKSKRESPDDLSHADMEIGTFEKILNEIQKNNIRYIEIAGGGEPFEHLRFNELINRLLEFRKENPSTKIGLLTNGLHLNDIEPDTLLHVFNDYIRISRYEKVLSRKDYKKYSEENTAWENNIEKLIAHKNENNGIKTKIGIKYLLNKKNVERFTSLVQEDFEKKLFHRFDHYRFRAERRLKNSDITNIESEIYYSIQKYKIPRIEDKLSISLTNYEYPESFNCWISPISCVFSPEGNLYMCCNYIEDEQDKSLGNICRSSFQTLWNSPKHNELRSNLMVNNCDKENYTNCRFAEIQDILDHFHATIGDLK